MLKLLTPPAAPTQPLKLDPPFPWFGGKRQCAHIVWRHFGDRAHFIEPFAGGLGVLLRRPHVPNIETINDKDCHIANFWRAVRAEPLSVAQHADWPVNEADLQARHTWLIQHGEQIIARLKADPDFYDPKIAGWWVWGISQWIGAGWCEPQNRHFSLTRRQHLSSSGMGIHKVHKKRPNLNKKGKGVHRISNAIAISNAATPTQNIYEWFNLLSDRLRRVRVCCGDWRRVLTSGVIIKQYSAGVFLDPPYDQERRDDMLYREECAQIPYNVRQWCKKHTGIDHIRIALCGYEGEHNELEKLGWFKIAWTANGGYGNFHNGRAKANRKLERIWFSPNCEGAPN